VEVRANIAEKIYEVYVNRPYDISIPVRFDEAQPSVFGTAPARTEPYKTDTFVGDVTQGGSCNCYTHHFTPHLNGTHTECVGHITSEKIAVYEIIQDSLIPATLITVSPREGKHESNTYTPALRPTDAVITQHMIHQALLGSNADFLEALVIRTLPNTPGKRTQHYGTYLPPFFSNEAMNYLLSYSVKHLLVDIPSIDRLDDDGKLTNHHAFWGLEPGSHTIEGKKLSPKTVTELIYVPEEVPDGLYLLNLQVAPIMADAAPSRPLLYEVDRI